MPYIQTDSKTGVHRFLRKIDPLLAAVIGDAMTPSGLQARNGRWFRSLRTRDGREADRLVVPLIQETDELLRLAALGDLPRLDQEQVAAYAEKCRAKNVPPSWITRLVVEGSSVAGFVQRGGLGGGQPKFVPPGHPEHMAFPPEGENYQRIVSEIDGFFHQIPAQPEAAPVMAAVPAGTRRKLAMTAAIDEYLRVKVVKPAVVPNIRGACGEVAAFVTEKQLDWQSPAFNRGVIVHFRYEVMPLFKTPRAPNGPGPATIKAKLSHIANFWRWAMRRNLVTVPDHWDNYTTPFDHLAPDAKEIAAKRVKNRVEFKPSQTTALLKDEAAGSDLGDVMRVCMTNGIRREEIASLEGENVFEGGRYYRVADRIGKTKNAVRIVPLVGMAREIVTRRYKAVEGKGPLFPDLPLDAVGKRGSALSNRFLRLRRRVLGSETDNSLDLHALRGTWRTAAERSGVAHRTRARLSGGSLRDPERKERTIVEEMGGWAIDSDLPYDHGLEIDAYEEAQRIIYAWMQKQGYFGRGDALRTE